MITDKTDVFITKSKGNEYILKRLKNTGDSGDFDLSDKNGYFVVFRDKEAKKWMNTEEKKIFNNDYAIDMNTAEGAFINHVLDFLAF